MLPLPVAVTLTVPDAVWEGLPLPVIVAERVGLPVPDRVELPVPLGEPDVE